jgi:hypothetical protein
MFLQTLKKKEAKKAAEKQSKISLKNDLERDLEEFKRQERERYKLIKPESLEMRDVDYYMWNDSAEKYFIIGKYIGNMREGGSQARIYKISEDSIKEVSIGTDLYIKSS